MILLCVNKHSQIYTQSHSHTHTLFAEKQAQRDGKQQTVTTNIKIIKSKSISCYEMNIMVS